MRIAALNKPQSDHRFRSILFLLVLVAISEGINRYIMHIPVYGTFFLLPVVYATFVGGVSVGLLSVGLVFLYLLYAFSEPNQLFSYPGDTFWTLCSITVGAIVTVLMMGRLQSQVSALSRRNETILNSVGEGIIGLDSLGKITFVNSAALRMSGWCFDELIKQPIHIVTTAFEKEQAPCERDAQASTSGHDCKQFVRKDGSRFPVEYMVSPINIQGRQIGTVISFRDISTRKQLEAQICQAQKMEAIGRLAGGVAHDFNNLLTVMNGYIDILLDETNKQDPRYKDVSEIKAIIKRASHLTRQLLAFSRQQELVSEMLDLNQVIEQMDSLLQRVVGPDIQLELQLDSELGTIRHDQSQLEQVIMNLVINARDAIEQSGRITIETKNYHLQEQQLNLAPGDYILLVVSDTGIGIDPKTRERIFEPFFTTKPADKGTGLGLSTVYGIVSQSGGSIEVASEVGKGTSFRIYLPKSCDQVPKQVLPASGRDREEQLRPILPQNGKSFPSILEENALHDEEMLALRD